MDFDPPLLEESASPFIDEGDGFTREREGVRSLLSLAAHAGGYKMMVGAHNTVLMSDACGRVRRLLQVWQMSVPATLLIPRGMQGVLPCSLGMVNADAHNTVDAQRHVEGALPCLFGMGVDGAYNTIGKISAPTTLLGLLTWQEGCRLPSCRCTGYGPRYYG